ncbi:hypothetical protein CEXT_347371 [Caerostris extrusa]|uniref:Uncharacterized protein n=1 Tax=Caerostris extrusa TaxID=172846 RepID=A0AAV4U1B0_CAEEX|nr:hypothetical protein CEXT_347371 [Caerostris extrusa]
MKKSSGRSLSKDFRGNFQHIHSQEFKNPSIPASFNNQNFKGLQIENTKLKSLLQSPPSASNNIGKTNSKQYNPLNCDCDLRWIPTLVEKFDVYGSCAKPDRLKENDLGS